MKRTICAIILLAAAVLTVILGRNRILNLCDEMTLLLEETIELGNQGNMVGATDKLDEFFKLYQSNRALLDTFVRRALVEEMLSCAYAASAYYEEKNKLDFICEAERTVAAVNAIKSSYLRTI